MPNTNSFYAINLYHIVFVYLSIFLGIYLIKPTNMLKSKTCEIVANSLFLLLAIKQHKQLFYFKNFGSYSTLINFETFRLNFWLL